MMSNWTANQVEKDIAESSLGQKKIHFRQLIKIIEYNQSILQKIILYMLNLWGLSLTRRGGNEELPFLQGKEQWLHFAGATVKRYPTSKVRQTQVRWYKLQEGIRGQTHWNHNHRKRGNLITRTTALSNSMKLSHAVWGHPGRAGHGGEVWQNVVHWRREWQTTSVFLPWEPHEQYEKAKW